MKNEEDADLRAEIQDARLAGAARQAYIAWRMNDLPSVYTDLMPFTDKAASLWEAETRIRRQYETDQESAKSPWRKIGPRPSILDYDGLRGIDRMNFGSEVTVFYGLPGVVKPGFEDHPDVVAARAAARESPLAKLQQEHYDLSYKIKAARAAGASEESLAADVARRDAIASQLRG